MLNKILFRLLRYVNEARKRHMEKRIASWGKEAAIGNYTVIQNPESLHIGDYTQISDFTILLAQNKIVIGRNCRISTCGMISSVTHKIASYDRIHDDVVPVANQQVIIGDNVWIGANVVILPGTSIGANSIIAAGSVVKGVVPENEIWGGMPAVFRSKINF